MNSLQEKFLSVGEYAAAGLYEDVEASLFERKARGIRRYLENCPLNSYNNELLYPSGEILRDCLVHPFYWEGIRIPYEEIKEKSLELSERLKQDFGRYISLVPKNHIVAGDMYTHSMPNYARIISEGLDSYEERVKHMHNESLKKGLTDVIEGIRVYHNRCLDYLKTTGIAAQLTDALEQVPFKPARNIYEAIVCWNFVLYLDDCDNLGPLVTVLAPYYKGEDIRDILSNLFKNLDDNNGYSMSIFNECTPLAVQCLEAVQGKRRPMIELFVDENTPDEIWKAAFKSIRTGNGQPAFYCEQMVDKLMERFPEIRQEDKHLFCGGGCAESMFGGLSQVGSLDAGINLLLIFESTMHDKLQISKSFAEFTEYYLSDVRKVVLDVTNRIRTSQKLRSEEQPAPMRTLLVDDCIDNETEYYNGGARYNWSIVNFAGLINVIDSMLYIKEHIYDKADITPEEVVNKCDSNDRGFLHNCRKTELHYGTDIPEANEFSRMLSTTIFSYLDEQETYYGSGFIGASIQFNSQVEAGKAIGATPDGREANSTLCDSLAAIFGKDDQGPTALLKSVAAIDMKKLIGTPILNFNFTSEFDDNILKSLILGYFKLGGYQIQVTCASKETLLEAYENPEMHRNLVVRVGGYSEYFNRLSDEQKRMIIDRTIQNLSR